MLCGFLNIYHYISLLSRGREGVSARYAIMVPTHNTLLFTVWALLHRIR